ncbi:homeobox protein 2-like [Cucurbita maxima]|uniref:Homeobox protein 2-like n=1 Tax=Cucurbita maxima TaxID=3661 RepID=A0A6J1J4F2_CUCMA|nr:homeobox protein 2-like [Cucurbita maxima]XP_022982394.1 homeobox protein 2-like [Cucurbita maxima]
MERDPPRSNNNSNGTAYNKVDISGRSGSGGAEGSLLLRSSCNATRQAAAATAPSDFLLQWGNRKRLRCMKVQGRDKNDPTAPAHRTTARIDRRVVRADKDSPNRTTITHSPAAAAAAAAANHNSSSNGYLNLRQRGSSPQLPPPYQRILRNSETTGAMRGHGNGGVRGIASPDRGAHDRRGNSNHHHHHHSNNNNNNHHHNDNNNKSAATSDTAYDSKKGGSSSGGSGEAGLPQVWPPKFAIALTNKEKEEDFLVIKGSKLPQRPKKRAKIIQRTVNLVSPGAWLSDLTLERYEVREKKISKKRPRGLKAMGNMESDSE